MEFNNEVYSASIEPLKDKLLALCSKSSDGKVALYDESIFKNGVSLKDFKEIGVSNRSDEYLVRRLGKSTTSVCSATLMAVNPRSPCRGINIYTMDKSNRTTYRVYRFWQIKVSDELMVDRRVSLFIGEPPSEASSLNVAADVASSIKLLNDYDDDNNGDQQEHTRGDGRDVVYSKQKTSSDSYVSTITVSFDYNDELTDFESAVILKYYATNYKGVVITRRLYHAVFEYFKDDRRWFDEDIDEIIVQNKNHELILNREFINYPSLPYYDQRS